ncbi:mechanosensitive ion channel family protein [Algibacter miyuki]|uniref:Mechanosensitive ion channel family protein n=1 Tax=Algibacter miyuki TaxID=1306933 RepID=A0ABV5H1T3_9FLAO|nr:mechanosensitive ion channel domain-containing protein [Algibacter miyuki]MDN3666462.1 mechanosensitive ion channel [Algibacter miyuki]
MQEGTLEHIEETIENSSLWEQIVTFLNYKVITLTDTDGYETGVLTVRFILIVISILVITTFVLRLVNKLLLRRIPKENHSEFFTIFSFAKWFVYVVVLLVAMNSMGINITAIFAASAALLIGIGLALQTLFQDIISGIFILIDQSVHVDDIIEIEGKVGRVEEIKLRTTRAVTIDNKVLIIPNHLYLTNSLYNWTQNGTTTRESVEVGVAYGSDVQLVKKLLLEAATKQELVLDEPAPYVYFSNFGDSSLDFKLVFTLANSFQSAIPKSDIRFEIDKLFRENNIAIPFPQRDIHIIKQ